MRITHVNETYISGDMWGECDLCGLDYRSHELLRLNGIKLCLKCIDTK